MRDLENKGLPVNRRFGMLARASILCAVMLSAASGCRQAATSPATTDDAAVAGKQEETPITAADVPMPDDYAAAVKRLGEYRDAIRQAVSSGRSHDAHRPLDETNIALERLPSIAKASGVPRSDWETIVVAGDDLAEAMAVIHEAIDAGQSPDYEAHAAAIDGALQRLRAIVEHAPSKADSEGQNP